MLDYRAHKLYLILFGPIWFFIKWASVIGFPFMYYSIGLAIFDPTDNRPPHSHNAILRQCAHSKAFPYPFRGARKRTGPSFSAARISEKIRPGNNAPSVGVYAFTSILSREVMYLMCRFSISNPTSIDGENPVSTSFSFSCEARS